MRTLINWIIDRLGRKHERIIPTVPVPTA